MTALPGATVAITGAASGIGRALAIELAARGADLALADRDEAGLQTVATEIAGTAERKISLHRVDVSEPDAVAAFAREATAAHPALNIVINNAGVALLGQFHEIDQAQIEVASSLGARPLRIVRQILLPASLPALVAGGSLCLLLTVNEFGIVLFIGAKDVITLPLLIYSKAIQEFDYTTACVIPVVNVVLSLGLYSLYRLAIAHFGGRRAGLV